MTILMFSIFILVSTANGYVDEWNLIHFSKSEEKLLKCLKEETDLPRVLQKYVNNSYRESYLIQRLSASLNKLTVPIESIDVVTDNLINYVGIFMYIFGRDEIKQLKETLITALNKCSDPERPTSSNRLDKFEPPRFVQERPELVELINLFFVSERSIFYDFSPESTQFLERGQRLIEWGLKRFGNARELFNELLIMWNRRARLFYDFNDNNNRRYIGCVYQMDDTYTLEDPGLFIHRRHLNYTIRDPPVVNCDGILENTSYRAVDWRDSMRSHIFSAPIPTSPTRSRCYFEERKNFLLRALFLHLELVDAGYINENNQYGYRHVDTSRNLFGIAAEIIYHFRQYLRRRQSEELSHGFANNSLEFFSLIRSLREEELIEPVDLLMMFWYRLLWSDNVAQNFDHRSEVFSTTTPSNWNTSSTFGYEESKRGKGQVTRLSSGKFKPKNQRKFSDDGGLSPPKICRYCERPMDMAEVYKYGYILDSKEEGTLMVDTVSSLLKNEMSNQAGL